MAGILAHIREITLFLNPHTDSYPAAGRDEGAALYQLVVGKPLAADPHPGGERNGRRRIELRSPDP